MNKNIFIGIGSNLGNREENIAQALNALENYCNIIAKSKRIVTKPVGYDDQDDFLNMVIEIETELNPFQLMEKLLEIEKKLGRKRTIPNGPRTIDLDILLYGNEIVESDKLIIPHQRMHFRRFVIEPLCQINENIIHPKLNKSIKDIKQMINE